MLKPGPAHALCIYVRVNAEETKFGRFFMPRFFGIQRFQFKKIVGCGRLIFTTDVFA